MGSLEAELPMFRRLYHMTPDEYWGLTLTQRARYRKDAKAAANE